MKVERHFWRPAGSHNYNYKTSLSLYYSSNHTVAQVTQVMWNGLNIDCKWIAKNVNVHLGLRVNLD